MKGVKGVNGVKSDVVGLLGPGSPNRISVFTVPVESRSSWVPAPSGRGFTAIESMESRVLSCRMKEPELCDMSRT